MCSTGRCIPCCRTWHTAAALASDPAQRVQLDGPALYIGRDDYPALPWTIGELVPSAWRNIYTGGLFQVRELRILNCYQAYPSLVKAGEERWRASIGLWWNQRFVIEHWLRVGSSAGWRSKCSGSHLN